MMRAMILAAGRGERMRPLTDHTPKPLLAVGGKPLIVWHIEKLAGAGFTDIVINHAWLGSQIEQTLGSGAQWGVRLHYSPEAQALETAGGITQALPGLGDAPFLVINGDIWCDWDPRQALDLATDIVQHQWLGWLLLVDNPIQHPQGDFGLRPNGRLCSGDPGERLTFSGIGIYQPALFANIAPGTAAPLAPLLRLALSQDKMIASHHHGRWMDIGTPARLAALDAELKSPGTTAR